MRMMKPLVLAASVALSPVAAIGQVAAPAAAAVAVDPERLAAARALMEQIMPPATRDQVVSSMMASMTQTMLQGLRQAPDLSKALEKNPKARPVFERFMARQQALATEQLKANLPGMLEAMAHAYARRFTLPQLRDMATFFATPTGQVYLVQAPTIMGDPDVAAWMGDLMRTSMNRTPGEIAKLMAELKALDDKGASNGG